MPKRNQAERHPSSNEELASTVKDPIKAEQMAYAEKPYREVALGIKALGETVAPIVDFENNYHRRNPEGRYIVDGFVKLTDPTPSLIDTKSSLESAHHSALNAAQYAANRIEKAYEDIDKAQNKLDELTK